MTSILSSCLIVLKLAMAVNNGLHIMLSNIYSVIENAMDSEQNRPVGVDTVEETSSAPAFQRSVSKPSQILEAFNRRRADPSTYDQTDVLVSNLTPFQEITITHKDVDGRRKRFPDPCKKSSRCPTRASNHSSDAWTNDETYCSEESLSDISEEFYSHESEVNQSRSLASLESEINQSGSLASLESEINQSGSLVSIESEINQSGSLVSIESEINQSGSLASLESVANESEIQSFVSETSDQIKESNVFQFPDTQSVDHVSLEEHQNSRSPAKKQPINIKSNFVKPINGKIKLNNQKMDLLTSGAIHRKPKEKCNENLLGVAYPNLSTTIDVNGEKISAGVNSASTTTAAEYFADRKRSFDESSKLCHELLQKYFRVEKNSANDLDKALKKSPGIEVSKSNVPRANPTSRNENQSVFEDNLVPIQKGSSISRVPMTSSGLFLSDTNVESSIQQNPQPDLNISSLGIESRRARFGYFGKYNPFSVSEHSTTYGVPISQKGSIKVDKLTDWHLEDSLASFTRLSQRYSIDMDIDNDTPFKEALFSELNLSRDSAEFGNEDILESSQPFLSDVKNNVPACAELNNSVDSEMVSIARFDTLARVLQAVGASEVLNELGDVQVKPLNDSNQRIFGPSKWISGTGNSAYAKFSFEDSTSTAESPESTSSQNDILNLDNFPLADLDTVEEQLKFLDKLSDSYLKSSENQSMVMQDNNYILMKNTFPDVFEERHKVILENISNAYKKELDLPTRSTGMCLEELPSIRTGNTGLETNFKTFLFLTTEAEPDNSREDCWKPTVTSPRKSTSDETLDVFGLPVFVRASESSGIECLDQENESSKFENENSSMSECSGILLDDKDNSGNSFVVEGTSNETSTPIRGEKSVDPSWISINLSSESLHDFNDYSKSRIRVTECINTDSVAEKDSNATRSVERMDTKCGPACSDVNVEDGATIQAKDWGNLAAQMSKHIEECISILSIGEDEDEDEEDEDEDDAKMLGDYDCEKLQSEKNCESKEGKYQENIDKKEQELSDETSSDIAMVKCSNPMSNIESLLLREELETASIYDN